MRRGLARNRDRRDPQNPAARGPSAAHRLWIQAFAQVSHHVASLVSHLIACTQANVHIVGGHAAGKPIVSTRRHARPCRLDPDVSESSATKLDANDNDHDEDPRSR